MNRAGLEICDRKKGSELTVENTQGGKILDVSMEGVLATLAT